MGIERLLLLLKAQNIEIPEPSGCDLYIAPMGDAASLEAMRIVSDLRANGVSAQTDVVGRSLKAQMKFADKIGAKYTMVLGDNEIAEGKAKIKNMNTGEASETELADLGENFMEFLVREATAALGESLSLEGVDLSGLLNI